MKFVKHCNSRYTLESMWGCFFYVLHQIHFHPLINIFNRDLHYCEKYTNIKKKHTFHEWVKKHVIDQQSVKSTIAFSEAHLEHIGIQCECVCKYLTKNADLDQCLRFYKLKHLAFYLSIGIAIYHLSMDCSIRYGCAK